VSTFSCLPRERHLTSHRITNISKRKKDTVSGTKSGESKANEFPVVNLSTLVQDVVDGVFLGHAASDNASRRETSDDTTFIRNLRQSNSDQIALRLTESGDRIIIIDIDSSVDWRFKTEAASWKRIVMNLFGNAMKFTKKGQITVKLYLSHRGSTEGEAAQLICVDIHDTGPGISEDYLKSHLFTAFSQADNISVGTGVGLSIVKRLVEELSGFIDVQSDHGIGTRVSVAVPLGDMTSPVNGSDSISHGKSPLYANGRHKGHTLYVQGSASNASTSNASTKNHDKPADVDSSATTTTTTTDPDSDMQAFFANLACQGFGMTVTTESSENDQKPSDASPHSVSLFSTTSGGAWTLCKPAHRASDGAPDSETKRTFVNIRQPFGPRTFASALDEIMAFTAAGAESTDASATRMKENRKPETKSSSPPENAPTAEENHAPSPTNQDQHKAPASDTRDTTAHPQETTHNPPEKTTYEPPPSTSTPTPHLLLVDDNAVNLKVLAASVKKGGCTYDQATDGQQALEAFKSSPSPYDIIFMDLSMPVLDGIEATREIRRHEEQSAVDGGRKRTRIIALTALDEDKHRQRAFEAGVDDFVTKPVKMARVRELARMAWDER